MSARTIIKLLKENKIIYDDKVELFWVYNPKLYERPNNKSELRVKE